MGHHSKQRILMSVIVGIKSVFDDKGIRNAQAEFSKIGKTISKVGAGVGLGIGLAAAGTTKFAVSALKGAEAAQIAQNRLDQVAKSMGIFGAEAGSVSERLGKFAEANELSLGIDADVIKATQAKLLTFKELALTADTVGGAMDRATMAAVDLAAAGFGSAETNAVQLGKALNDPIKGITALGRAGVTFTAQEKEKIKTLVESGNILEAQNTILSAIETQVGGTAKATASSFEIMRLAAAQVMDEVGFALMPAFEDFADVLVTDVAPILADLAKNLGPALASTFELITDVIKQATDPTTDLGKSFAGLDEAFSLLVDVLKGGRSDLDTTTDTLGGLADALNFVITTLASFIAFLKSFGPALDALMKGDFATFQKWLTSDPIEFVAGLEKAEGAVNSLSGAMKGLKSTVNTTSLAGILAASGTPKPAGFGGSGAGSGAAGTKKEVETTKDRFAKVQKVIKDAQKKLLAAEEAYARSRFELNRDAENDITGLRRDALKAQLDLVKESQSRLTGAFAAATRLSLGDLFGRTTTTEIETQVKRLSSTLTLSVSRETEKVAFSSVSNIIEGLSKRLAESRRLLTNASQLASEGFSQTFIEQVIETGAETGNALADAILGATPESKAEMRRLFGELETVSETGMDTIAKNIYDKFGLATRELNEQSKVIQDELLTAIADRQALLATSLADAGYQFGVAIKGIKDAFLTDLEGFDGWFAGLGSTIDKLLAKMGQLSGTAVTDVQKAITAPTAGTVLAGASVTNSVAIKEIGKASGIVIDSMADVAGTVAYIQARIAAANTYIRSSSSNAIQEASARNQIAGFTAELANLRGAAATGTAAGTVININVKADSTQSQAMVGKTIGNIVTKYVTTGGQVLVSGQN
jgi:hypothetical protein